jgi:hypothetical protein
MTIEEMRQLHAAALNQAESKRTELRLVLASRYRELVGSSDEVIKMKERSQELHDLVQALPLLLEKLNLKITVKGEAEGGTGTETDKAADGQEEKDQDEEKEQEQQTDWSIVAVRRDLSRLPRVVHRALDVNDVFTATTTLMELFLLIASRTNAYPLANALQAGALVLSQSKNNNVISAADAPVVLPDADQDPALVAQMRMIFLQVQTLPNKIERIASKKLLRSASYGKNVKDPSAGAEKSAAALASLDLLSIDQGRDRAGYLLEKYFESKAQLLASLLNRLAKEDGESSDNATTAAGGAGNAEEILSKIVLILQHDVIVHPYQIFCLRNFPVGNQEDVEAATIMQALPAFDKNAVKVRCSKFLSAHLPLIRTKVKSVLVAIAGTTASALGQIRQSLYDKTDGGECMQRLDDNGVCTWDEALDGMVDGSIVKSHAASGTGADDSSDRRFSLWSALFSNTFSSLVHSLLTTSFESVHTRVVTTLRSSLANAPPLSAILPHEAYRNTLQIATELDRALLKVKDDAHELLVHAEERDESERRLRQSLYVQTCEIMGRLVCELRRTAFRGKDDKLDATKELIVGRLCYLLKFRLTSLSTLLDPKSSPAAMRSTSGMISYVDLQSAFELADDNEDGLITFDEAIEAVESAFSGTQFHGAEMIKETLSILAAGDEARSTTTGPRAPLNVTLSELTLLTARGLRHESSGPESALGTVQKSLDDIVDGCFQEWAVAALETSTKAFASSIQDFLTTASNAGEAEWQRIYTASESTQSLTDTTRAPGSSTPVVGNVSPHIVGYILNVSSILSRTTCPSDSLSPVPSIEYALSLGIDSEGSGNSIPTMIDTIRRTLLRQSLVSLLSRIGEAFDAGASSGSRLESCSGSPLLQLHLDVTFVKLCYYERNHYDFGAGTTGATSLKGDVEKMVVRVDGLLRSACDSTTLQSLPESTTAKHQHVLEVCDLFFSSLFGEDSSSPTPSSGDELDLGMGAPSTSSLPLIHPPLASSRRFVLLPVQSDRSLSDLQLRGKYIKEKEETESRQEAQGGSVMSSGLGFFSSMLKKK